MSRGPGAGLPPMTSFRATLDLAGKTATGVRVPDAVVEALGGGRQPLVHVALNGHAYRSKIAVRGGEYRLPVSAENRAAAGVAAGDEVEVALALDTDPREIELPADLAAALAAAPAARGAYDALSASRKQAHVLSVESARTPETRERRIAKVVETLSSR